MSSKRPEDEDDKSQQAGSSKRGKHEGQHQMTEAGPSNLLPAPSFRPQQPMLHPRNVTLPSAYLGGQAKGNEDQELIRLAQELENPKANVARTSKSKSKIKQYTTDQLREALTQSLTSLGDFAKIEFETESYKSKNRVSIYNAIWRVHTNANFEQREDIPQEVRELARTQSASGRFLHVFGEFMSQNDELKECWTFQSLLEYIFKTSTSDFLVRLYSQYSAQIFENYTAFYMLFPPLGPTLHDYLPQAQRLTPIELFRIVDHMCAACHYLHTLQPHRLLTIDIGAEKIILDYDAVAQGQRPLLAGPIRLQCWRNVYESQGQSYQEAENYTQHRIQAWRGPNHTLDNHPDSNEFLLEGQRMGDEILQFAKYGNQILKWNMLMVIQNLNLPPPLVKIIEYLHSNELMLGRAVQDHFQTLMSHAGVDVVQWLESNGHTFEDFRCNVLVYQGNPGSSHTVIEKDKEKRKKSKARITKKSNHILLSEEVRKCILGLEAFEKIELAEDAFNSRVNPPKYKTTWKVYPKAMMAQQTWLTEEQRQYVSNALARGQFLTVKTTLCSGEGDEALRSLNLLNRTQGPGHSHFIVRNIFASWSQSTNIENLYHHLICYPPLGPSLADYLPQMENITTIEIFRLFDHICSAGHYLHTLQPEPLMHTDFVQDRILLDHDAVAAGRANALLNGPIRLQCYEALTEATQQDLHQAQEYVQRRVSERGWRMFGSLDNRPTTNVLLVEGRKMYSILIKIANHFIKIGHYSPTLFQASNLPPPLLKVFECLRNTEIMLCAAVQERFTIAMSSDDMQPWFRGSGHVPDDFRCNVPIYQGRRPSPIFSLK